MSVPFVPPAPAPPASWPHLGDKSFQKALAAVERGMLPGSSPSLGSEGFMTAPSSPVAETAPQVPSGSGVPPGSGGAQQPSQQQQQTPQTPSQPPPIPSQTPLVPSQPPPPPTATQPQGPLQQPWGLSTQPQPQTPATASDVITVDFIDANFYRIGSDDGAVWCSHHHYPDVDCFEHLFRRARKTLNDIEPELKPVWNSITKKILASGSSAMVGYELRMAGTRQPGASEITLWPSVWIMTSPEVAKKKPWKKVVKRVKSLRWLQSSEYVDIFNDNGLKLGAEEVLVPLENLPLERGSKFPDGSILHLHVSRPGHPLTDFVSACGLICLVTIVGAKTDEANSAPAILHQSFSRVGGLINFQSDDWRMDQNVAVTTGHGIMEHFLARSWASRPVKQRKFSTESHKANDDESKSIRKSKIRDKPSTSLSSSADVSLDSSPDTSLTEESSSEDASDSDEGDDGDNTDSGPQVADSADRSMVSTLRNWEQVYPTNTIAFTGIAKERKKLFENPPSWALNWTVPPIAADFSLIRLPLGLVLENSFCPPHPHLWLSGDHAPAINTAIVRHHVEDDRLSTVKFSKELKAKEGFGGRLEMSVYILVGGKPLTASLLPQTISVVINGAKFTTRKLRLDQPLAQGTSGSWVVDSLSNRLRGSILAVFDKQPFALMTTAGVLFSDIKQHGDQIGDAGVHDALSRSLRGIALDDTMQLPPEVFEGLGPSPVPPVFPGNNLYSDDGLIPEEPWKRNPGVWGQ